MASTPTTQIIDHRDQAEICIEIALEADATGFEFSGQLNYQVSFDFTRSRTDYDHSILFFIQIKYCSFLAKYRIQGVDLSKSYQSGVAKNLPQVPSPKYPKIQNFCALLTSIMRIG